MHRRGILHRDIKLDNILIMEKEPLSEIQVCIADLGLACRTTDLIELTLKCGTPGYVGPEVLRGQKFSEKSDIFSLGCLFYNLITGRLMYHGRDPQ